MTVYRFDVYKFPETKSVPCSVCGKKVRRSRTFTGTSNPYTSPPYMSRQQMAERLATRIAAWKAQPERHAACTDGAVVGP